MTKDTYKQQARLARSLAASMAKTEFERKAITAQLMAAVLIFNGKITEYRRTR